MDLIEGLKFHIELMFKS